MITLFLVQLPWLAIKIHNLLTFNVINFCIVLRCGNPIVTGVSDFKIWNGNRLVKPLIRNKKSWAIILPSSNLLPLMKVVSASFCLITTLQKHVLIYLYQLLQLKKLIWLNLDTPALLMRNFIWLFFFRFCALVLRNWGFNRQRLKFFKFPLSLNSQKRPGYKENTTKYRGLSWKPWSHVKILICCT